MALTDDTMDTGAQGGADSGDDSVGGGTGLTDSSQDTGARGSGTTDSYDSGGGRRRTDTGGSSGGSSRTERFASRIGTVTGGVGDVVDSGLDAGQNAFNTVQSGVNQVSDTLPGATGTAFAAGAGVAAIPEPTPVTEVSGAAIAGGAALVGGGVLASRALRNRGGEIGVGERVRNELEVGQSRTDVSEVGVGGGVGSTTEVPPGRTGRMTSEVGLGSTTSVSEVGVDTGSESGTAGFNLAEQVGLGQQQQQISRDEETFTIGRDTIDNVERTDELDEDERMRQIRDQLERRQEFVREDTPTRQIDRDPVRFPADEAATGTAPGLLDQVGSNIEAGDAALGTATGAGGLTPDFIGGNDRDTVGSDVTGAGTNPASGASLKDTLAGQVGAGSLGDTGIGTDTTTDTGTTTQTDTGAGTGTDTIADTVTDTTLVDATATAQGLSQSTATPTQEQFAQPELTGFETSVAEPTQPGTGPGSGQRDRRPRTDFEADIDDDTESPLFGTAEDQFGSGILGGSEAAADAFGRL